MKIIILEDKKHFTKSVEVVLFPPVYEIAMPAELDVFYSKDNSAITSLLDKTIKFYPQGKPEGENGVEILRYREH